MPAPFIWRYTATPNATLPKWAQNKDLFTGGYVSSNGRKTARLASNISANRSGKVTNGFMKALYSKANAWATSRYLATHCCNRWTEQEHYTHQRSCSFSTETKDDSCGSGNREKSNTG